MRGFVAIVLALAPLGACAYQDQEPPAVVVSEKARQAAAASARAGASPEEALDRAEAVEDPT